MDCNLTAGLDTPGNWVDIWNAMAVSNDLVNANTGQPDPRHMYGVTNQDVTRAYPSLVCSGMGKIDTGVRVPAPVPQERAL